MEFRHPDHKKASVRPAGVISHCEMTPAAWREQFSAALRGSPIPVSIMRRRSWVKGPWHHRPGPAFKESSDVHLSNLL